MLRSRTLLLSPVSSTNPPLAQMISPLSARNTTTGRGVLRRLFLFTASMPPVRVSIYCMALCRRFRLWLREKAYSPATTASSSAARTGR